MLVHDSFAHRLADDADPFEVGRELIRQFATAVGEDNPACHDPAAARALGYRDIVAPATFLVTLTLQHAATTTARRLGDIDLADIVHRDQSFTHHASVHPGDRLVLASAGSSRELDGRTVVELQTTVHRGAELVCEAATVIVHTPPASAHPPSSIELTTSGPAAGADR